MDEKAAKNLRYNRIGGWILAVWGAAILVRSAINGNLYGSASTYGTGVIIGNALAVAFVVIGLYYALKKAPKIR